MMKNSLVRQLHVLVLGKRFGTQEIAEWLRARARIEHAADFHEAVRALESQSFDLVVSSAEDLLGVREVRSVRQTPAQGDAEPPAVMGLDLAGKVLWSSPQVARLPDDISKRVHTYCRELAEKCRTHDSSTPPPSPEHFHLTTGTGSFYELTAAPVSEPNGTPTALVAVVSEMTQARRLQGKLDAIDRAGSELVRIDAEQISRLNVQDRLGLIEQKVIRCTRELLHFDHVAVFVLDRKTNKLELALSSGMPTEVRAIDIYANAEGNGISGYVAAHGHSYLCNDVKNDPHYLPGLSNAASSLTVPLRLNDQLVGVFNVESNEPAAFTEQDLQFAEIFGRYIAIALHTLELLISERHTTTGQLGRDVMAEITTPLNDTLTEIETLKEDYIGLDDLRKRLGSLSENVARIRDAVKRVTSPKHGVIVSRAKRIARFDPILKAKRILIVDDEDMIRETVRDVLAGYGCEVTVAQDGLEAIEFVDHQPFDLVLSDIKLPGKNGYEVFAAAKRIDPQTPVILMTGFGYDPNHSIVRANREGLTAVLFKPFKVDQLLGEIRTALKAHSG